MKDLEKKLQASLISDKLQKEVLSYVRFLEEQLHFQYDLVNNLIDKMETRKSDQRISDWIRDRTY